jgi:pyrimidine-nucleoside phosphorylase
VHILDVIAAKRDGRALTREQIGFFVDGASRGTVPDYQLSALLMAVVTRGMTADETWWLTDAMVRSGARLDLSDIPGVKISKHSTGGVGDKTSIVLAPLAAACGIVVPKMSGRGLGHTGGTLDKLESIPGFRVNLSLDELRRVVRDVGTCLIGQSPEIAPADKRLYALRDVTGTVESIPLIASSVMSKKLAEGTSAIVLDVKVGRGAFMKTVDDARALGAALVAIGALGGVPTDVFITRMDQPLGRAVGNALEIIECIETLKGRGPAELESLVVPLVARMVTLANRAPGGAQAESLVRTALTSGAALDVFRRLLVAQGGDPAIIEDYGMLPTAPRRQMIVAPTTGAVRALHADLIGRAAMSLGAGRARVGDPVDHAVGAVMHARVGDRVRAGDPLVELHYRSAASLDAAVALATSAIEIAESSDAGPPLIVDTLFHREPRHAS